MIERKSFNHQRLVLARKIRRLTKTGLSDLVKLKPRTITRIESGNKEPEQKIVQAISDALKFPVEFFMGGDPFLPDAGSVSFRSLAKMRAKDRDGSIADVGLASELLDWIEVRFRLPEPDLPDFSHETDPEAAASVLRQIWRIGVRPIGHITSFLEEHGVRFFSTVGQQSSSVDACSLWIDETPLIFLNHAKTAEHSIFDAAHELGHLVLHKHSVYPPSRSVEREANMFASAFLMPEEAVRPYIPWRVTPETVLREKARWRVSAMAMLRRLYALKLLTDWQYKGMCIEFTRRGFRSDEPDGIERERSVLWPRVFSKLWRERMTMDKIADSLHIDLYDLERLMGGLIGPSACPDQDYTKHKLREAK